MLDVIWHGETDVGAFPAGHGIAVYDTAVEEGRRLIAFVDGFAWYHGLSDEVTVHCIEPDDVTGPRVMDEMKSALGSALADRRIPPDQLTARVTVIVNT